MKIEAKNSANQNDLYNWVIERPAWQQDIISRLLENVELSDNDLLEVRSQIESLNGIISKETASRTIDKESFKDKSENNSITLLGSIGPLKNVDRLAEDQKPLTFAIDGITLVYGPNGSGKSGYCRITKKLCRSLHKVPDLKSNVFNPAKTAERIIRVDFQKVGGTKQAVQWNDKNPPPAELAEISVFDSHAARLYVDSERKIDFLPFELDLLNRLANICRTLDGYYKGKEDALTVDLKVSLPIGFNNGTKVSAALSLLNTKTPLDKLPTENTLRTLGKWDEDTEKKHVDLSAKIKSDPKIEGEKRSRAKKTLEIFRTELQKCFDILADIQVQTLILKRQNAADKRQVAQTAAKGLFGQEPIQNLGGDAWKQLLRYARDFALEIYPEAPAPQIANGKLCVLCHQELTPDAKKRLENFDNYLSDKASQQAESAKQEFLELATQIRDLNIRKFSEIQTMLGDLNALNKPLAEQIEAYFNILITRHSILSGVIKNADYNKLQDIENLVVFDPTEIDVYVNVLTQEINTYKQLEQGDAYKALLSEHLELLDQKKLSTELAVVINYRNKLEELKRINLCRKACASASITSQINKLREIILTPSLKKNIEEEIEALDLRHLPLKMHDKGDLGSSKCEIALTAIQPISKNSDILSEGEHRSVALACFLAEMKEWQAKHGIIIDDPVSSLDHTRMERVAKRLVKEAKEGRQVIIFTHNLTFHNMVLSESILEGVPIRQEWITKKGNDLFGIIDENQAPWVTLPVKDRLKRIEDELQIVKPAYDRTNEAFRNSIRIIYTMMRETWEKIIEEYLFAGVVERFRPEIRTLKLREACISPDDKTHIFAGMTRCSKYSGHDRSVTTPDLPKFEDIEEEYKGLLVYAKAARIRMLELEKTARAKELKGVASKTIADTSDVA